MRMSFPCARYTELRNEALQTEEVRKFQADNAVSLRPFREISGFPFFLGKYVLIAVANSIPLITKTSWNDNV